MDVSPPTAKSDALEPSAVAEPIAGARPLVALVGRPNVGKSTLFNRLTRSRDALVADLPGLTRDRQYGLCQHEQRECLVVDTGGLSGERDGVDTLMAKQTWAAIDEADAVLLLVDAREGLTAADEQVAAALRRTGKPIHLVANKIDGVDPDQALAELHALGLGEPQPIAAAHGRGISKLMERVWEQMPSGASAQLPAGASGIRIAIVGRPNVGKSTLVNRVLGEERVVAFDQPGTTRDSIFIPFSSHGRDYTLIDTAGVRRRGRVKEAIEKFSVIKAMQAIAAANVVILLVDAQEGIVDQDLHLLGFVLDSGRALVIAINKWDGLATSQREQVRRELDFRLSFIDFARIRFISALHGSGVGLLLEDVERAYASATVDLATPELTRLLEQAVNEHQPPLVRGRRVKLRYAHQGGRNPPVIVVHGNQTEALPNAYRRYLENYFRSALGISGTPLKIELKSSDNPFAGRRNLLTPRQQRKRERLMKFVKRTK